MTTLILSAPLNRDFAAMRRGSGDCGGWREHAVSIAVRARMGFSAMLIALTLTGAGEAGAVASSTDGSQVTPGLPPYGLYVRGGSTFTNLRGEQEHYFGGTSSLSGYSDPEGYWYYLLSNGDLYEFTPPYSNPELRGVLVARLGSDYYEHPEQLTYSLYVRDGSYNTDARGQQEKYLGGTASAYGYRDSEGFWYYILPNGDLYEFTPPYSNPELTGELVARMGTLYYDHPNLLTYKLHQHAGSYFDDHRGEQEKYLRGTLSANGHDDPDGYWYYLLPNGDFYEFSPPYPDAALSGMLVDQLGPGIYENPAPLLTNAVQIASDGETGSTSVTAWDAALFTQDGSIDRNAYVRACTSLDPLAIDHRLGPSASFYGDAGGGEAVVYQRFGDGTYDWLTPGEEPLDYAGHSGQVAFVPDEYGFPGISLASFCWSYHENHGGREFWHRYMLRTGIAEDGGQWWTGRHDPCLDRPWFLEAMGADQGHTPVAMGRARTGWANYGIVAFRNGVITVAGSGNDGNAFPVAVLPAGKVPTAVIVTNNHEFALVTVWDINELKGQVAIIALRPGLWMIPSGVWGRHGFFRDLRPLAFVDLPDSMRAPTSIAMSSDFIVDTVFDPDPGFDAMNLSDPAVRQRWLDAGPGEITHGIGYPRRGYAVIASRAESCIALLDLAPLYRWVRAECFEKAPTGAPEDYYWPGALPDWALPRLVTTLPVPQPTFVTCGWPLEGGPMSWGRRFLVGTMDGRVIAFDAGSLVSAEVDGAPPTAAGEAYVGRNPCGISHSKRQFSWDRLFVVCRGERSVVELYVGEGEPYVLRELRDVRFQDPVAAEIGGTRNAAVLSIADFTGRQIVNYLVDPLHPWEDPTCFGGLGADGTALWECTGVTAVDGFPFMLSGAEVP